MKHYAVVVCEHESNHCYCIQGDDLKSAIKNSRCGSGEFEWTLEAGMSVDDVYDWIKNEDGGEEVYVLVSDSPFDFLTL